MQLFYSPEAREGTFFLDADESRHCLRVLRKKIGDTLSVVDGQGNRYDTEIISDKNKLCEVRVLRSEREFGKRHFKVTIAIALPKNIERFEWFLEKATEIGVDNIQPMITARTERAKLKVDRLNKILIGAMKQSGKAYLPTLHKPENFDKLVARRSDGQCFIAVCKAESAPLKSAYQHPGDVLVLIGPEGDFTDEEINKAVMSGFKPVSLGTSRFRVETAGVLACYVINLMNE